MKSTLAAAALVGALVVTGAEQDDELSFRVPEGSTLTKRFSLSATLEVDESIWWLDEFKLSDRPVNDTQPRLVRTLLVRDQYGPVERGCPLRFRRTFVELDLDIDPELAALVWSDLYRRSVAFELDAEGEQFDVSFDDEEPGDPKLLEGLREDLDLRGLLPPREVDEGDVWEIDPLAFADALVGGGDLGLAGEPRGEPLLEDTQGWPYLYLPELPLNLSLWTRGLDGEIRGEHAGGLERDGLELVEVWIEFDVGATHDLADYARRYSGGLIHYTKAKLAFTLAGDGTLLWDPAAGRFHSLRLEGEVEIEADLGWAQDFGAGERAMRFQAKLSGDVIVKAGMVRE